MKDLLKLSVSKTYSGSNSKSSIARIDRNHLAKRQTKIAYTVFNLLPRESFSQKRKCPCCGHFVMVTFERVVEDGEDVDGMNSTIKISKLEGKGEDVTKLGVEK